MSTQGPAIAANSTPMQIGLFRGEVGLMRAAEKAERIAADWMDSALGAVLVFSIGHVDKPFTMEAARVVVERLFPRPEGVDGRVWGHITRRAIKCGYIERVPGMFAQAASSNGSPKPCYRGRGWGAGA